VSLADLDERAVLQAVKEFDRLGRVAFLDRYGFEAARDYLLIIDGRRYDSKAIAGGRAWLSSRKNSAASLRFHGRQGDREAQA